MRVLSSTVNATDLDTFSKKRLRLKISTEFNAVDGHYTLICRIFQQNHRKIDREPVIFLKTRPCVLASVMVDLSFNLECTAETFSLYGLRSTVSVLRLFRFGLLMFEIENLQLFYAVNEKERFIKCFSKTNKCSQRSSEKYLQSVLESKAHF